MKRSNKIAFGTCWCALISFSLMGLPALADEYPSFDFSGNIMVDYDKFDNIFIENSHESSEEGGSELEIRRLRLGVESDFNNDWSAKFKIDVKDGVEVKDAYLKYSGWEFADFTVGKQKEPFGLERLMSSKNLLMIERTMINGSISPARNYGVKASGSQSSLNWQLGYFQKDNDEHSQAITGRVTWTPWQEDKNFVHIGSAFSERNLNGLEFRVNQRLEIHSADSLIEGATFNADSASLNSLEFIWQYKGLTNMAEWQQTKVTADDGSDYQYDGGYYQIGYLFSGKNRKYKNGILGGVNTKNDWEVTMRYSQLTLHEENSEAKTFSMGLNYYYNKNLKFMADFVNANYVDEGIDLGSGNGAALRVQYKF